jgi:hypothetical protein
MLTSLKRKTERNVGEYMLDETWRPDFMLAETLKHDCLSRAEQPYKGPLLRLSYTLFAPLKLYPEPP